MWTITGEPETDPRFRPAPPTGQGPALEWYRNSRNLTWQVSALSVLVLVVFLTVSDEGISWMTDGWWAAFFWGLIALSAAFYLFAGRRRVVTAGAEWLQAYGHAWVRTYELVEVKLKARGAAMDLCLKDTAGRTLEMELRFVENNPLLWDLVYNGILHSVHIRPRRDQPRGPWPVATPPRPAWRRFQDAAAENDAP